MKSSKDKVTQIPCRNVGMMLAEAQGCCHKCSQQQWCWDVPLEKSLCLLEKHPFIVVVTAGRGASTFDSSTLTVSKDEHCDYGEEENGRQPAKVPYSQKVLQ